MQKPPICQTVLRATVLTALLATGFTSIATGQTSGPTQPAANTSPAVPLHSRAELETWLKGSRHAQTPLDALPPLARQRFLDSLVFTPRGLAGFAFDDLVNELTPSQGRAVLALFGVANDAPPAAAHRHPDGTNIPVRAPASTIEQHFDRLYRAVAERGSNTTTASARYIADFAPHFAPDRLDRVSDRDLVYLMRAAELMSAGLETRYLTDLSAAAQELERRGAATRADLKAVFNGLLLDHRFEQAHAFALAHPDAGLPELPAMQEATVSERKEPTVWQFDAASTTLFRTPIDLSRPQILVMAGCHFSQDAARDILKDAVLGPLFARHASWLFLPLGQEDLDAARVWNQRFPQAPVQLLYARSEWPILPEPWTMPTFLFVKDGKVVESLTGWPRDNSGQRKALISALRLLGLATP